jgi:hypothetical protein
MQTPCLVNTQQYIYVKHGHMRSFHSNLRSLATKFLEAVISPHINTQ